MWETFKDLLSKPVFWTALGVIAATIFNLVLYLINKKTFQILYEKPRFRLKKIQLQPQANDTFGSPIGGSFIIFDVTNSSTFQNKVTIILKRFPFGPTIKVKYNEFGIPPSEIAEYQIPMDHEEIKPHINGFFILTFTDLKRKRTRKFFRLSEKKSF